VFEEAIDFSLEAAVPDPLPFDAKLRAMLDEHEPFIVGTVAHAVGADVLAEVGQFSLHDGSANKLETEQEREQEQEQQKEVKARRDQQVEIEKFVDREYSRNEEKPTPWALKSLLKSPPLDSDGGGEGGGAALADGGNGGTAASSSASDHPFYALRKFALRHQESLEMPLNMFCSRNYFNPNWSGLRRIKNVVMVMEWAPADGNNSGGSAGGGGEDELRLFTAEEHEAMALASTKTREASFHKAFDMLSSGKVSMTRSELALTVRAMTDAFPTESEVDSLLKHQGSPDGMLSFEGLGKLLRQGKLHPQHKGRFYVALSLAEAGERKNSHAHMMRGLRFILLLFSLLLISNL
jgi:hypothetical protein